MGCVYIWIFFHFEWISYVFTSHGYISYMDFCNTIWTYSKYIYICINIYICLCVKMTLSFIYSFKHFKNILSGIILTMIIMYSEKLILWQSANPQKKNSWIFYKYFQSGMKEQKLSTELCVCMHVCMMPLFHIWFVTLLFKLHWLKPCSSITHGSPIRRVWIGGLCNISNHKLH